MCHVLLPLHTSPQPPLAPHAPPREISSDSEGSKHQPMVQFSVAARGRQDVGYLSYALQPCGLDQVLLLMPSLSLICVLFFHRNRCERQRHAT